MRDCYCFGHGDFRARMNYFYPGYTFASENIAYGYTTGTAVVSGWKNSSSHRSAMLDSRNREAGVGWKYNQANGIWFTVLDMGDR